ncbi:MAG: thioredoxin domain-containing protein [Flavobacteriaceae bacterium]|nr:thioredoxin domain-containing protein [Flavobacteriaceae bacterium]
MNQLKNASSPYLQQHANNPVHWQEWGNDALEKAKSENKPLLISIGYAACHWCHVMARETFMNEDAAAFMNAHFVCIKIDREERPDVDQVYMEAVQAIKGSGGWPLNAFALPNGKPFYAGTYYPTQKWISLLKQITQLYENEFLKLVDEAYELSQNIQKQQLLPLIKTDENIELKNIYLNLFASWKGRIDVLRGGFGGAPKFPLPVGWNFLLEYYYNHKDETLLKSINNTLTAMALGGIYDQIGGGFARYSVDAYWRVPHFEKMLYDNGQLISLYANAYIATKNPLYKKVIIQTLEFIERELMNTSCGFYASLNADSEGEEGTFYVFTKDEIQQNFEVKLAHFIIEYYHFTDEGNWEDFKNTLFTTYTVKSFSEKFNLDEFSVKELIKKSTKALFNYREKRIRPTTDTKVLTSWNALMLQGYIDAYRALNKPEYLEIAIKNANFLTENQLKNDFSLWRNFKDDTSSIDGFLEDYALLSEALLKLYQLTFNQKWLGFCKEIIDYCMNHFYDSNNGLFTYTSNLSDPLYVKKYELFDNVIPSSNAVMAHVLYRLGLLYDDEKYISIAKKMLNQMTPQISNSGPYAGKWASLLGFAINGDTTIAIVGKECLDLNLQLQNEFLPFVLYTGGTHEAIPFLKGKCIEGKTAIYICQHNTCSKPIFSIKEALELLNNSKN